jgi:hypothetical protein
MVGANTTFSVSAGGAKPLAYQWFFNRTNLVADGTNASLVLTNVGAAMAGDYSVVVANSVGTATSAVARLSVTFPPTHVSIPNQIAVSGNIVSLPVLVRANGNENSISFSLSYDRARLQFLGVEGGSGAGDGVVLVNDTATNSGSVGIAFALPPQATLATGTQEVVRVEFYAPIVTHASSITQLRFMDQPVVKRVVGVNANTLQSSFSSLVTITLQATPLESDVYPRSQGNRTMEVNDWVQTGRFVVGLDQPSSAAEFQRIDSAPRATRGDGQFKVTDWVQAGRYAVGIDPMTAVGGPTSIVTQTSAPVSGRSSASPANTRVLKAMANSAVQGLNLVVPILLDAQGNENAVGFSLNFDPAAFDYVGTVKGSAVPNNGSIQINANQAASGRLGVAVALSTGQTFATGSAEIARVTLRTKTSEPGSYQIAFGSVPSTIGVSDALANELPAVPVAAAVAVNPAPTLLVSKSGEASIKLSWPAWAASFQLQGGSLGTPWTNLSVGGATNLGKVEVTLPVSGEPAFFRLQHP